MIYLSTLSSNRPSTVVFVPSAAPQQYILMLDPEQSPIIKAPCKCR